LSKLRKVLTYSSLLFFGFLGIFNSTKLELRQETNSNLELLFQNAQIISTSIITVTLLVMLKDIRKFRKSVRNEKGGDNNVAIGKTDSEVLISTPKIEIEELK
tara:strand:+ start:1625 stop:1933 length:309 start_codon:yes stop_codon:yes gene_type:complete